MPWRCWLSRHRLRWGSRSPGILRKEDAVPQAPRRAEGDGGTIASGSLWTLSPRTSGSQFGADGCWCVLGMRGGGVRARRAPQVARATNGRPKVARCLLIVGSNGTAAPRMPGWLRARQTPRFMASVPADTKPNTRPVGEAPRRGERARLRQRVPRRGGHWAGRMENPLPNASQRFPALPSPSQCHSYGREHPPSKAT